MHMDNEVTEIQRIIKTIIEGLTPTQLSTGIRL